MFEWLLETDRELFLYLHHLRTDWLDPVMLFLSAKKVWIPLYAAILGFIIYRFRKGALVYILFLVLSVVTADRFTSGFMKPHFARYRPCHEPALTGKLEMIGKCGGKFGFASSHAANTLALATFWLLLFRRERKLWIPLLVWALLVSYSRIYLGVHYPGDILAGGLAGSLLAVMFFLLATIIHNRFRLDKNRSL